VSRVCRQVVDCGFRWPIVAKRPKRAICTPEVLAGVRSCKMRVMGHGFQPISLASVGSDNYSASGRGESKSTIAEAIKKVVNKCSDRAFRF
jgi:hypothetical protein